MRNCAIGQSYTIAWEEGSLNEKSQNGAVLLDVLWQCLEIALEWNKNLSSPPVSAMGRGFTIVFGLNDDQRMHTLKSVLSACNTQVIKFQIQPGCNKEESSIAIVNLIHAADGSSDLEGIINYLLVSINALETMRDRVVKTKPESVQVPSIHSLASCR